MDDNTESHESSTRLECQEVILESNECDELNGLIDKPVTETHRIQNTNKKKRRIRAYKLSAAQREHANARRRVAYVQFKVQGKELTQEQRDRRNALERIRRQNASEALTEEEREEIRARRRVSALTEKQRERKNAKERERRKNATPEERERICSKKRVNEMTREQRERRNAGRRHESLTQEQIEQRRAYNKQHQPGPEQRESYNIRRKKRRKIKAEELVTIAASSEKV